MTTVEKLNYLISIKSDIKTAIENKGVDMAGVSFLGYASKIGEIVSGVGYTDRDVIEGRYQYNISNSASFVYSSAFEYKAVQTVDLPNCLYVGNRAFFYCTSLTTVNLPSCTALYDYAFRSCNNLSSISLPNVTMVSGYCFGNCTALETISLPKCSYLRGYAFWSCYNLNTIYMGTELSTVATMASSNALLDCSALQSIYVPASLVDAYKSAENWSYYSSIIYPFGPSYYIQWQPTSLSSDETITVNSVTYSCIDYPSGYMPVSKYITDIHPPIAITSFYTNAYLETINYQAFALCDNLVNVTIPQCLSIGSRAFYVCEALQRIESSCFPACEYVSYDAFYGCSVLSYVFLPKCSVIGSYAFNYCSYLDTVILPCCSQIMTGAFRNTAPSYTISGHPGLRSVYIGCGPGVGSDRFFGICSIADDAFGGRFYNSSFTIYVPYSQYSAYMREYSSTAASSLCSHFMGI